MLTNPMETQLVASLGVKIGGRTVTEQPLETIRTTVATAKDDALAETVTEAARAVAARWSPDAMERLARVPGFVRGMVKRIYAEYARDHGIAEITPAMMDRARTELGLEGM
jgi:proto-chlorophyllide reductase subunit